MSRAGRGGDTAGAWGPVRAEHSTGVAGRWRWPGGPQSTSTCSPHPTQGPPAPGRRSSPHSRDQAGEKPGEEHPQLKGTGVRSEVPQKAREQGRAAPSVQAPWRQPHGQATECTRQPTPVGNTPVSCGDCNASVFLFRINLVASDTSGDMK